LQGAEIWKLRIIDQKCLVRNEMLCWGMMENISWSDGVKHEVTRTVK